MIDCTDCGTTFDPDRNATGTSTRCPSCGTDHPDATHDPRTDGGRDATELQVGGGATVRITIEVLPGE